MTVVDLTDIQRCVSDYALSRRTATWLKYVILGNENYRRASLMCYRPIIMGKPPAENRDTVATVLSFCVWED